MKNSIFYVLVLAFVSFAITGCVKSIDTEPQELSELQLPEIPYNYADISIPTHFNMEDNTPSDNQMTDHGATLGRVLFYEKAMSKNNTIACASCHEQSIGFANATAFSTGFEGQITTRNSMSIANHRFAKQFFWNSDQRALEEQVMAPIANHIEMGMERTSDLVIKIDAIPYYDDLFTKAFGSSEVTSDKIGKALAQFLRSMVSADSKFDKAVMADNNFADFTELEKLGFEVFRDKGGCEDCHHTMEDFAASWRESANIGLDMDYADEGAGNGHFKIPSLRNVAVTGPYMHDGRYETLEEVIEHYDNGVKPHPNLDWALRGNGIGGAQNLELTFNEKQALKAFLLTLTDEQYLTDVKYSNPFID